MIAAGFTFAIQRAREELSRSSVALNCKLALMELPANLPHKKAT